MATSTDAEGDLFAIRTLLGRGEMVLEVGNVGMAEHGWERSCQLHTLSMDDFDYYSTTFKLETSSRANVVGQTKYYEISRDSEANT